MISQLLRNARNAQGLSIAQLTDILNERYTTVFSKSALQRYEKGADIPPNRLFILADFFHWSLDLLAEGYVQNSRRR
ncbi:helix-turn-helix domain-containing protein [Furfurilactobacillus curtus]|uniref:HTH cro/C1-type domain-containing protein n=1 Tax=Furfurilactobacillus curtus TaxID=1746200 RepID=A0ABQ5JSD0_9LACO